MKKLDLVQGTDAWLEARLNHFTASEAAAMMGDSKFMSRNQLLDLKKGWESNPVDSFKERLFQEGHEFEEAARPIAEMSVLEDLPAVVGSVVIGDLELLASFDGLSESNLNWEHKMWSEILAENVRNGLLEPLYYWQLEHQMLVAGNDETLFTVSNGTAEKWVDLEYKSDHKRRAQLIAGWIQFADDLKDHQLEAKQELMPAREVEALPSVEFRVEGSLIISNIADCLPIIRERAELEMSSVLETDQDFADKDKFNKNTKAARVKLKDAVAEVQREFTSLDEFVGTAKDIDGILQKLQSHGEKQVKDDKERRKKDIMADANQKMVNAVHATELKIQPISIRGMYTEPNFTLAMKNKRTLESIQNAVDEELATVKIEITAITTRITANLVVLRETAEDYKFLFNDLPSIINQEAEPFSAIVKSRIADHKQAEEEKLEQERKRIRLEEQQKAEEKVRREAEEKAEAERLEAERVAKEEADRVAAEEAAAAEKLAAETAEESKPEQETEAVTEVETAPVSDISSPVAKRENKQAQPPSLMGDLTAWCDKHDVSLSARGELRAIIAQHTDTTTRKAS